MGKATGLDKISNEMTKYGFSFLKESLLKLFNLILKAKIVPADWCKGLISPIFKSDDKMNPDNYRAICVTSCLSKLFSLILNDRLTCFLKTNNIKDSKMQVHAQTTFRHFVTRQRNRWILVIFPYTLSPTTCYPNSYNLTFLGFPIACPLGIL